MTNEPLKILRQYWGHDSFRPLQEDIITSVLKSHDTLALMPTGGGKSICFQIPALVKDGICIVVSPLIALMKDQVNNLLSKNIPAAAIYSGMYYKDIDRTFDNCIYGNTKLLYLSPERLMTDLARERLQKMNINLIAVDEAHCVSQWGYDFRPPYLKIAEIRELIPKTPILALTATATPEVVLDIQEKLAFNKGHVFKKSFTRANLAYVVLKEENKRDKMVEILRNVKGTGIVYARNRKLTKDIAQFLHRKNISADFYHAGLNSELRTAKQEAWMKNKTRIMVCTNAFGMGIDKPDVRTVIHLDLPDSLEAYFQEAGRAGRDGKKSFSVLLYMEQDKLTLERNYENAYPSIEEIKQVYRALGSYFQLAIGGGEGRSYDFDIVEFCKNFKFQAIKVFNCLKMLEQSEWIVLTDAVFLPSSLKITVSKDQLYDYLLKNPKFDLVLKSILRLTQGAFSHYVNVRERKFADFLKISVGQLIQVFNHLKNEKILDYRPQKDTPQIIFLQERTSAENLILDQKRYKDRKERHHVRIQKAISYAENTYCRSQQLLRYFGESDSKPCGICDVCLGRTKSDLNPNDYERYKNKIKLVLKREALSEEELFDSFKPQRHNQVILALEFLLDEGIIEKENGKLIWTK